MSASAYFSDYDENPDMEFLLHPNKTRKRRRKRKLTITLIVTAFVLLTSMIGVGLYYHYGSKHEPLDFLPNFNSKSVEGVYNEVAVATDAPYCAVFGREILQKNGSAMDAAISILLCMGVVIPESMGLGGGCIITNYHKITKTSVVINGREVAPQKATSELYAGKKDSTVDGPLSIAVPGELRAYWEAHQRFGKLPWKDLFDGAIRISEKGFIVHEHLANALSSKKQFIVDGNLRSAFVNPETNEVYKEGERMKRPDLARTFRRLANSTVDLFYSGKMAEELLDELAFSGSIITKDDFLNYEAKITKGFTASIDDMTIHTAPLPASGPLLTFLLRAISKRKELFPDARWTLEGSVSFYHQIVEIFKHAYAERALLGDPDFDNVETVLANLTSDKYINYVLSRIDPKRTFDPLYYGSVVGAESHGTSHVAVADAYGNVVSASSTINTYFGSKIMSKATGIIFNDEMDDFSFPNVTNSYGVPPTKFNHIEPGKRPFSSMCPSVIIDSKTGDLKLAVGGSGGTQITTGTALVAVRNLLFEDSIKVAIDAPRLHHQLYPNLISYESNFPRDILSGLEELGHKTELISGRSAVIVGISKTKDGVLNANSDYRKGGSVDGY